MNRISLPMKDASNLLDDVKAYFREPDELKRNELLAKQAHIMSQYLPGDQRVGLAEMREIFFNFRDVK
jgi:hypothetical protein